MFERILSLFGRSPSQEPLPEPDAALALGALLIRVAKADALYRFEEIGQIDLILAKRHGLNPVEAAKMRATCEKLEARLPQDDEAAHIIARAASQQDREAVIDALWEVSLADGVQHPKEHEVMRDVVRIFDLPEDILDQMG